MSNKNIFVQVLQSTIFIVVLSTVLLKIIWSLELITYNKLKWRSEKPSKSKDTLIHSFSTWYLIFSCVGENRFVTSTDNCEDSVLGANELFLKL